MQLRAVMASACSIVMANDGGMLGSVGRPALHTRASTCILVTLSLLCALVLVICGVLVVREWALSRTFDATVCVVRNVTYAPNDRECSYCTSGAKDSKARMEKAAQIGDASHPNINLGGGSVCVPAYYPCVYVVVVYGFNSSRGSSVKTNQAKLYESSAQATSMHREVRGGDGGRGGSCGSGCGGGCGGSCGGVCGGLGDSGGWEDGGGNVCGGGCKGCGLSADSCDVGIFGGGCDGDRNCCGGDKDDCRNFVIKLMSLV